VSHKRRGENYALHGNLGTGNDYSSYIFKAGNRDDMLSDTLVDRIEKRVTNVYMIIYAYQFLFSEHLHYRRSTKNDSSVS